MSRGPLPGRWGAGTWMERSKPWVEQMGQESGPKLNAQGRRASSTAEDGTAFCLGFLMLRGQITPILVADRSEI